MFKYGIGGVEVPQDVSEGFVDIPMNRTMFIQKLTNTPPAKAEIVQDLKTVEEVFGYYKPNVDVEFDREDGSTAKENIRFNGLGDFSKKGITDKSAYLQNLTVKQDQYLKFLKQLKSNKLLKQVLENKDSRQAYLDALKSVAQELDEAEKH